MNEGASRYRITRLIQRGGMAEVFEANIIGDGGFSRQVAIKRLLPDLEAFNRTIEAVHGLPIPGAEVAWSVAMGVAWVFGFLLVAVMAFERRDFR